MRLRQFAIAASAVPLLFLAACGGTPAEGVATAGGDSSTSPSAAASSGGEGSMLKFAQCMREHGIEMPDPKPGEPMRIKLPEGGSEEQLEEANKACRKYIEAPGKHSDPMGPKMRDALLKFAQCMREHGVDMPDPKPGQGITIKRHQVQSPEFQEAQQACEKYLPGVNAPRGTS